MPKEIITKKTNVFNGNLFNNPVVILTTQLAETEKIKNKWVVYVENLPVQTFRDGAYQREILGAFETCKEALDYHDKVIRGEK